MNARDLTREELRTLTDGIQSEIGSRPLAIRGSVDATKLLLHVWAYGGEIENEFQIESTIAETCTKLGFELGRALSAVLNLCSSSCEFFRHAVVVADKKKFSFSVCTKKGAKTKKGFLCFFEKKVDTLKKI